MQGLCYVARSPPSAAYPSFEAFTLQPRMSSRLIIRRYNEIRNADTPSSPSSPSGGLLAAAIVPPVACVICVLIVFTVMWHRRAQRRRAAEHDPAHAQLPVSAGAAIAPTQSTAAQPKSPSSPPPTPPSKSPLPAPGPSRRPSLRERFRTSFPGLAARLSGGSGGSGNSRVDPVLPRTHARPRPPAPQVRFNADNMFAPRRARPRSMQQRAISLGPPLSPPPTEPLPPTPTSASAAGGTPPKESEGFNGGCKPQVRPLPPLPSMHEPVVVLRPNRLGESGSPLPPQQEYRPQEEKEQEKEEQEGYQQQGVLLLAPSGRSMDGGPDGDSDILPPPYTSPAYRTRSGP